MVKDDSSNKTWQKSLIYFNLALALLMPSKTSAQNSEILPENNIENMQTSPEDSIKIIYDEYDRLSNEDLKQMRQNINNTGMDIRYNAEDNYFQVRQNNTYRGVWLDDFNIDKELEKWEQKHNEIYSKPTDFNTDTLGIDQYVYSPHASFNYRFNRVTINIPTQENKAKAISNMMKRENLSFAEADSVVNEMLKLGNDPVYINMAKEHEKSHAWDHANGIFKPDLSLKYLAQLEMLTEVKASMTMAGLALQHYKENGDLSHFAYVNCEVDTLALQNDLKAGKGKENMESYVAKYIFDKWMETHNVPDTYYSGQVFENAEQDVLAGISVNIGESPEMHSEYLSRVQKMFSDIKGLGNVNVAIKPDFTLNKSVQNEIDNHLKNGFASLMSHGTVKEDMKRIEELLLVIRDLDKNGKRSPKTQAAIDKAINNFRQYQPQTSRTYDMAMHLKTANTLVK